MAECTNDNGVWTCSGMLAPVSQKNYADCTDGLSNTMIVGEQSDYLQDVDVNISAKYRGDPGWTGATGTHRGWMSGTNRRNSLEKVASPGAGGNKRWNNQTFNINTVRYKPDLKKVIDGTAGINGGGNSAPGCCPEPPRRSRSQQPAAVAASGRHPGGDVRRFGAVHGRAPSIWPFSCGWRSATTDSKSNWIIDPPSSVGS